MKSNQKIVAAAVLLSLTSASAWAVAPASLTDPQTYLRIGGATATDAALRSFLALSPTDPEVGTKAVCQAGTVDVYNQGSNDFVVSCLSTGQGGLPAAGTQLAIVKNSTGGSANGIGPVSNARPAATLSFLNFTAATAQAATCPVTSTPGGTNGVQVYNVRTCVASSIPSTSLRPDAGISDVDPKTFVGTGGVTLADVNGIPNVSRAVQVVFAPIVSEGLYARLQAAEGLGSDNSLANMPSLPKAVLRGIFASGSTALFDWDQVYVKNKTSGLMVKVGDGTLTHPTIICRRGDSSGTMTSFKIHFLEQGCAKGDGIAKFISPDDPLTEANGTAWVEATHGSAIVFAGAGGGDVRKCVSYGTTSGTGDGTTLRNEWRIGILATDNMPKTTTNAERFRYIRVDDQEPTLVATQEGRYDFFTENTLNDRGTAGPVWAFIKTNIGNRAAIAAANGAFLNAGSPGVESNGASDTGVLAAPVPGTLVPKFPIVAVNVRSQLAADGGPVNSQSRTLPGAGINNCNNTMQVVP